MIIEAKKAGAKIIKLQTYKPDTITLIQEKRFIFKNKKKMVWEKHAGLFKAHTPWIWHKKYLIIVKK